MNIFTLADCSYNRLILQWRLSNLCSKARHSLTGPTGTDLWLEPTLWTVLILPKPFSSDLPPTPPNSTHPITLHPHAPLLMEQHSGYRLPVPKRPFLKCKAPQALSGFWIVFKLHYRAETAAACNICTQIEGLSLIIEPMSAFNVFFDQICIVLFEVDSSISRHSTSKCCFYRTLLSYWIVLQDVKLEVGLESHPRIRSSRRL